jgi:hypothetical protein
MHGSSGSVSFCMLVKRLLCTFIEEEREIKRLVNVLI